jgi:hypothetical protein
MYYGNKNQNIYLLKKIILVLIFILKTKNSIL